MSGLLGHCEIYSQVLEFVALLDLLAGFSVWVLVRYNREFLHLWHC